MDFNPQDATAHLVPADTWCDSTIIEAIDTTSKKGNSMILATFKVYDNEGKQPQIDHYFVDKYPGMLKKLCAAMGMSKEFEAGRVPAESLKGKSVKVLIKIQEDESGRFGDKNVIAAFQSDKGAAPQPSGPATNDPSVFDPSDPAMKDDSVPF